MAQTQSPTNEGYVELAKLLAGQAASAAKSVVLIKSSCTADATQTFSGVTKCTESGLAIADGTVTLATTTVTNDTVQVDKTFTSAVTLTVLGFGVCNDDDDVLYSICCFNAGVALENLDTLAVQMKMQIKVGA